VFWKEEVENGADWDDVDWGGRGDVNWDGIDWGEVNWDCVKWDKVGWGNVGWGEIDWIKFDDVSSGSGDMTSRKWDIISL